MKLPIKAALILCAAGISIAQASEVATTPVGVVTVNVAPSAGTTPRLTFFSAPLSSVASVTGRSAGKIAAISSSSIECQAAGWSPSALSSLQNPHLIKITSGQAEGHTFRITANTESSLTLDTQGVDLTTLGIVTGDAGDTFTILQGDTLLSLFGESSPQNPILGGTTSQSSDNVMIHNGVSWSSFYFNTNTNTWRSGASPTNRGNTLIRPDQGILYSRLGTESLQISFTGEVPIHSRRTVVTSGLTALSNLYPAEQTLFSSKVQDIVGWSKVGDPGVTVATAHKLMIHNGTSWSSYHFNSTVGQWRSGASPTNRNGIILPAGGAFLTERPSSSVQVYNVEAPYSLL